MKTKRFISMKSCSGAAHLLVGRLMSNGQCNDKRKITIYGVPHGGVIPAYMVAQAMTIQGAWTPRVVFDPGEADIIVDDLRDSGKTVREYKNSYPSKYIDTLYTKAGDLWYVFPWETDKDGEDKSAEDIPIRLLQYIGEDSKRGGLKETPQRFLGAWEDWTCGYRQNPESVLKTFIDGSEGCDEMVLVRDIPVYSHCEHHLAPFFGVAHVGYIPKQRIVGLSKLPRLVDIFAKRLQVQERLTNQVANALMEYLKPAGVGVVLECRHMCMESRGIQRQGCTTTTSALRGGIKDDTAARAEFMRLIR